MSAQRGVGVTGIVALRSGVISPTLQVGGVPIAPVTAASAVMTAPCSSAS